MENNINECKCNECGTSVAWEDDGLCDRCLEREYEHNLNIEHSW
jgi:endogenous inhibitor of DNA gyrase (YacG/DUF329 family)